MLYSRLPRVDNASNDAVVTFHAKETVMAEALLNALREEKVDGPSGKLFIRSWRPAGTIRGVVMIVPGFNSHSGHYLWVAEQLTAEGLAVYAVDLRGRGQSDGERFYVESVPDYVHDVETLAAVATSREPGLPVFLFGHSAGGVVSCTYTLEHQAELAGLICEDFAFQVPAPDVALAVLKGAEPRRASCARLQAEQPALLARSEGRPGDERRSAHRRTRRSRPRPWRPWCAPTSA